MLLALPLRTAALLWNELIRVRVSGRPPSLTLPSASLTALFLTSVSSLVPTLPTPPVSFLPALPTTPLLAELLVPAARLPFSLLSVLLAGAGVLAVAPVLASASSGLFMSPASFATLRPAVLVPSAASLGLASLSVLAPALLALSTPSPLT